MQNQQQMAAMAGMNATGPVDGTPIMGNGPRRQQQGNIMDPRDQLNTYIYDYFLRNSHTRLARMMMECDLKMNLNPPQKPSPNQRNMNGVDEDSKDDLPQPKIPTAQATENSFLLDWWVQFWDIFSAARGNNTKGAQYIGHTRTLTQMQTDQRNQRMMMAGGMGATQYQNMMRAMPNGVATNDLKRAAAMNNRNPNANPMANMNQMKNPAMMGTQMQRDGSQMDMNGQRPQSPGSNENAPSPNKRPRVGEGAMNAGNMPANQFNEFAQQAQNVQQKQIEVYAQSLAQQQRMALNNNAIAQGMNSGVQGSPMNQQGLDGQHDLFAGNQPRPGMPAGAPGPPQGNHALQDYQMQLMLLEQQNKKRLLMARQEQDNMSGPHAQGAVGGPGFPPSMSPQGSRAGPSPNPTDQMKKGTPRMGQQGLPGSPMPEGAMQQQRNSPAPNMPFDPSTMPPGMPPQYGFPGQMPQTPMMRPPSSHPGNFNGQQLTPQQMEAMQRNGAMPNGVWRGGPQGQPGMMPNQQQMGPMGNNPQQRGQMPPPPAPAGEQPRAQEPSPSQPAQAPPTPSQANKAAPKKKNTKNDKKPANKAKGANTGATPAASGGEEPPTPTPSTPITPMHPASFKQNGQPQPPQQPAQPQPPAAAQQQPPPMNNEQPFGNLGDDTNFDSLGLGFDDQNALENFDFDSFLHVGGEDTGFGSLGADFGFDDAAAVGGDM